MRALAGKRAARFGVQISTAVVESGHDTHTAHELQLEHLSLCVAAIMAKLDITPPEKPVPPAPLEEEVEELQTDKRPPPLETPASPSSVAPSVRCLARTIDCAAVCHHDMQRVALTYRAVGDVGGHCGSQPGGRS